MTAKQKMTALSSVLNVANTRWGFASWLGKMFGGARDVYKVFGYDTAPNYAKCWIRYCRQDITARIVDAPADALWSNPPTITSTDPKWNEIWNDLVVSKNLWNAVNRADKMAGMGEFSVLLFGLDKTSKMDQPAVIVPERKLLYFQPYSVDAVKVSKLVDDTANARYMKPEIYAIQPGGDPTTKASSNSVSSITSALTTFNAHHSRLLHIAENCLQDEVYGTPRLIKVYNLLDDLLKIAGGTAETFWLAGNRGLQVDIDKEMELSDVDAADLADEIDEYQHQLRRVLRTRGVKVTNLGSDIPNPSNGFEMTVSLISGSTGIPKRILLGSEAGQLASGQDRNNWAERIEERRKNFGEPVVIWPLIRQLAAVGVLPTKDGTQVSIKWPDAFKLTPLERAQTSAQKARSAANVAKAMTTWDKVLTPEQVQSILNFDEPPETALTGAAPKK